MMAAKIGSKNYRYGEMGKMTVTEMKRAAVADGESAGGALAQKLEAGVAAILDPALDPQTAAAARFRRIVGSIAVAPGKEAAAAAMIDEYLPQIIAMLRRCDYAGLEALLTSFDSKYRYAGLSNPIIPPPPAEQFGKLFAKWGWLGEEIDAAIARIKPEEGAGVRISWNQFEAGGHTITRESIRLGLKPRHSNLSDAEWLARFPIMKYAILDHGDIVFPPTRPA